ncbi:acetyl-coenzyme A transporter 1 [Lactifluus volemus]|nr:acetyl-coenzyme A transporter 1 [Lactifluus volemus]
MGLLAGAEHASEEERDDSSEESLDDGNGKMIKAPLTREDKKAMTLLIVLYLIQGVPLGMALDTLPFLLRERLSYSKIAIFTLSSYPYSVKLLWSPIVDSWFFPSLGRRRSWIIPMQTILGSLMFWMSFNAQAYMTMFAVDHIYALTLLFTLLVVIAATQGWSLTLLSRENLSYASMCQTVGLTTGWLMSFTVFLALNSEDFRFWSIVCFGVTLWLIFVQKERKEDLSKDETSIIAVYKSIWSVSKLKSVRSFLIIHLTAKIGFAAHDAATSLKMVEKGLRKEDFAMAALLDFPIQVVGGYFIARWSRGDRPLRPWIWANWPRITFTFLAAVILWFFPPPPITAGFFAFIILFRSLGEMTSTTQFVCIGAFHARVSDPVIGGTYITLLNTFINLGHTWPKFFVLRAIDLFTIATCEVDDASNSLAAKGVECVSEQGKTQCSAAGGTCAMERDGYYITTAICISVGLVVLVAYIVPTARKLQVLPLTKWRIAI